MSKKTSDYSMSILLCCLAIFFLLIYIGRIVILQPELEVLYDWEIGLVIVGALIGASFGALVYTLTESLTNGKKYTLRTIIMLMALALILSLIDFNLDPSLWIYENLVL